MRDENNKILDDLCKEYRSISKEVEMLSARKKEITSQILALMTDKHASTSRYKVTKIQQLIVKTPIATARALNCVITKEEINKPALKKLYKEGVQIPDIHINEWVKVTELSDGFENQ